MAIGPLTDAYVSINSVVLSDHVDSVEIQMEHEDLDITAMGATSRAHVAGLRDDRITINFFQDHAASEVDATLNGLLGLNAGFPIEIRPSSAAVSATNPKYTGTFIMLSYTPISGTVGEVSQTEVEFVPAAGSQITRAEA